MLDVYRITSRRWFSIVCCVLLMVTAILATTTRAETNDLSPGAATRTIKVNGTVVIDENPSAEFIAAALEQWEVMTDWSSGTDTPFYGGYVGNYGVSTEMPPGYEEYFRLADDWPPFTGWWSIADFGNPDRSFVAQYAIPEDENLDRQFTAQQLSDGSWPSPFSFTSDMVGPGAYALYLILLPDTEPSEVWAVHVLPVPEPASVVLLLAAGIVGLPAVRRLRTWRPRAICLVAAAVLIPLTASTTHAGTIDAVPWRIVVDEDPPAEFVAPALEQWEAMEDALLGTQVGPTAPVGGDYLALPCVIPDWRVTSGFEYPLPFAAPLFTIAKEDVAELETIARQLWTESRLIDSDGDPIGLGVYAMCVNPFSRGVTSIWAVHVVPEPATGALLMVGALVLAHFKRRR